MATATGQESTAAENKLKRMIEAVLDPHFEIHPEVNGRYLATGKANIIDYILVPKPDLIAKGFTDRPIGLEVKAPTEDGSTSKTIRLAHQALTYAESEYPPYGRPAFVLVFPSIDKQLRGTRPQSCSTGPELAMAAMRTLKAIMQMGGAGSLRTIRDSDTQNVEWNMEFAVSSSYWDSKRGPGNLQSILQRDEWRRSR